MHTLSLASTVQLGLVASNLVIKVSVVVGTTPWLQFVAVPQLLSVVPLNKLSVAKVNILYWKRDKFIHFIVHYYYFGLKPWITLFYFIHDLKVVAIHIVQFYPFRSIKCKKSKMYCHDHQVVVWIVKGSGFSQNFFY